MNERVDGSTHSEQCRDAFISAVYPAGAGPYKVKDVYYTVTLNTSTGTQDHEGIVPSNIRPRGVDIWPARVGQPVQVSWAGQQAHFTIIEQPAFSDCGGTP